MSALDTRSTQMANFHMFFNCFVIYHLFVMYRYHAIQFVVLYCDASLSLLLNQSVSQTGRQSVTLHFNNTELST